MAAIRLGQWLDFLRGPGLILALVWLGLAVLTGLLLVMMYTRWGQWHPLRKCLVLSALAHLLLGAYSTTAYIAPSLPMFSDRVVSVWLADGTSDGSKDGSKDGAKDGAVVGNRPEVKARPAEPTGPAAPARQGGPSAPPAPLEPRPAPPPKSTAPKAPEPGHSAAGLQEVFEAAGPVRPLQPVAAMPTGGHQVPDVYQLRTAPNRSQIAKRLGASSQTEAAVKAALRWLAENQESDGRWSVAKHGGGRESYEAGRDRQGAGAKADAAITALALLAFTANGNTHLEGPYRANVGSGIQFLLQVQRPDGNLAGQAEVYELMYCHGMATLALGEVCGMSGDQRLREPLRSAVAYIVAAQDPYGGGWRYRPKDPGDTSQLGWQLMALKSAELAGIRVPEATWQRAARFLESVSGGNHGGLASYRPGERFTRTMTAEALACREFLGLLPSSPTCREAADYLLGDLPGDSEPGNLYYWYYATMALYPIQGSHWRVWSGSLHRTLVGTQRRDGVLAGSWDPTTRWDGYGGRVYSTAMAALCLQTYYRFFPVQGVGGG